MRIPTESYLTLPTVLTYTTKFFQNPALILDQLQPDLLHCLHTLLLYSTMTSQRRSLSDTMRPEKGLRSPAVSPKRTLPSSPRTRRKFLRESEDDSGVLLIEQYIYRRDRFRSTSLDFPFPAPMILSELQQEVRIIQSLVAALVSFLALFHDLVWCAFVFHTSSLMHSI